MPLKKILLVSHSPYLTGGAELTLLEMITFLHKNQWDVKVILPAVGEFSKKLKKLGVGFQVASYRWSVTGSSDRTTTNKDIEVFNADSMIEAYTIINDFKPDIVLTNTIVIPWYGYVAKAVGITHVLVVSEMYNKQNNLKLLPNDSVYIRQLSTTTDFIFYNSQFTQSTYGDIFNSISSTILHPVISIEKKFLKSQTNMDNHPTKLLVFGSIVRHKNQLEVLKALLLLPSPKTTVDLTIIGTIGDRPYYVKLKKFIKDNDLNNIVTFLPHIPDPFEEILKYDIIIVPSLLEAFGRVTVEGQLLGRVVIGRATGATKELIKDGETGLLYTPDSPESLAEKIDWAIKNPMLAKGIATQGQVESTKEFITKNSNTLFASTLNALVSKPKEKRGDDHFNYVQALIERNIYVNNKIKEYAHALDESIKLNHSLEIQLKQSLKTKIKSALRRVRAR